MRSSFEWNENLNKKYILTTFHGLQEYGKKMILIISS